MILSGLASQFIKLFMFSIIVPTYVHDIQLANMLQ